MLILSQENKEEKKRKERKPKATTAQLHTSVGSRIKTLLSDRLPGALVPQPRGLCFPPQTSIHKQPVQTTAPNAHPRPPKETKKPGLLSKGPRLHCGSLLALSFPPASLQSASARASGLPAPASPRPEPCTNRGMLSPKSTSQPPHPEHWTVHYFTHFKFPPVQGQLRKKKSSWLL